MTVPDISVKIKQILRLFPIKKTLLYCQNTCIKAFSKEIRLYTNSKTAKVYV